MEWTTADPLVHPMLLLFQPAALCLDFTEYRIDWRCLSTDRRFIRCYYLLLINLFHSSNTSRKWTIGSSNDVFCFIYILSSHFGMLWCPRFLISIISANDWVKQSQSRWLESNLCQPGSSPRKPSRQRLMILLSKSTQSCGQTLVKGMVKPQCLWTSSRTFAAFSKFHLNISKLDNIIVVRLF
jgi:hypothetical protein